MSMVRALGALIAAAALAALAIFEPRAAADGWRAAFLLLSAAPLGAVSLLLIARLVGANWQEALGPLLPFVPWLALPALPVVLGQALFHHPVAHLHFWLSWPFFLIRSAIALGFWSWMARSLMRGGPLLPGPALLAHGVIVSFIAFDWIMGVAPAQPNSAIGMVLATMQIGAACAFACLTRSGDLRRRRDFSYLMIACGLALAYFLYMDFVIVWFGNLPAHVGWYLDRHDLPAALLPGLCLILGLFAPALLVPALRGDRGRVWSAASALIALALIDDWFVAGPDGWAGLAAMIASIAVVLFLALPARREARA